MELKQQHTEDGTPKPFRKMSRISRDLTFLLTGMISGAIIGLLYAPEEGKITRDKLSFRLSKYREQIEQLLNDLMESADLPENLSKNEGQRVVNDAREKAERLLEDVDRLMAQIKQQNA
jgi:gas vesicle protein